MEQPQRLCCAPALRCLDRIAVLQAVPRGRAHGLDRTGVAGRVAWQAHGGTEVHQALRVARHRFVQRSPRQQLLRVLPQAAHVGRLRQVRIESEHAGQHPLHIAVENRRTLAEAEGGDRGGRGTADSGQRLKHFGTARKLACVNGDDLTRGVMQIAGAAVVTEAGPAGIHLVEAGGRQCAHVRKARQKTRVVLQHARHLRLLQHDFGEPDAVRIARVLPGQAVPAV